MTPKLSTKGHFLEGREGHSSRGKHVCKDTEARNVADLESSR